MFYDLLTFIEDYKNLDHFMKKKIADSIHAGLNGSAKSTALPPDDLKAVTTCYMHLSDEHQFMVHQDLKNILRR